MFIVCYFSREGCLFVARSPSVRIKVLKGKEGIYLNEGIIC